LVRRSYEIPAETFDVNVVGTANVLESVIHLKKKCTVIVITTDKVYENKEHYSILYNEDDVLGGYDPYSTSKACTELVVNSFRNSFFNINNFDNHQKAIASVRAGNVIGGGDWNKDRIIPDIVRSLKRHHQSKCVTPAQYGLGSMCLSP
jgi:CDP-glucose 4,6-dehydratase